jgi:hypothetical protein
MILFKIERQVRTGGGWGFVCELWVINIYLILINFWENEMNDICVGWSERRNVIDNPLFSAERPRVIYCLFANDHQQRDKYLTKERSIKRNWILDTIVSNQYFKWQLFSFFVLFFMVLSQNIEVTQNLSMFCMLFITDINENNADTKCCVIWNHEC